MAKVYVFLADGFEDVEALIPVDVLRRGGVDVITVSTTEFPLVESAHGVNIEADIQFEQGDSADAARRYARSQQPVCPRGRASGTEGSLRGRQENLSYLCCSRCCTGTTWHP